MKIGTFNTTTVVLISWNFNFQLQMFVSEQKISISLNFTQNDIFARKIIFTGENDGFDERFKFSMKNHHFRSKNSFRKISTASNNKQQQATIPDKSS